MFEKKRGTRFLASVMALVMLLSLAPVGALAAETGKTFEATAYTQDIEGSSPNGKTKAYAMWKDTDNNYYLAIASVEGNNKVDEAFQSKFPNAQYIKNDQGLTVNLNTDVKIDNLPPKQAADNGNGGPEGVWIILVMTPEELKGLGYQDGTFNLGISANGFDPGDITIEDEDFKDTVDEDVDVNPEPPTPPTPPATPTNVYVYFQTQNTDGNPVSISGTSIKYNDHSWATLGKISTTQTLTSGETYTGKDNPILNAVGAQAKDNLKDGSLYDGNASIAPTVLKHIQWTKLEQYNGADNYVKAGTTCWHLDGQITGYKVTYATGADEGAVDGMPAASETYYLSGSDYTVSDATPTRNGCTFAGWKSSNSNDNTVYTAGSTMTMPGEDVTLTAVWEQKETPGTPTKPTKAVDAKYFVLLPGRGTPASGEDQGTSYYLPNETNNGGITGLSYLTGYTGGGLTAAGRAAANGSYTNIDSMNGVFNRTGIDASYLVVPTDLGYFTVGNWTAEGVYSPTSTPKVALSNVLGENFNTKNISIIWYSLKKQFRDGSVVYHVDGYVKDMPVTLTYHDNFTGSSKSYTQNGLKSGETTSIAENGTVSESKTFSHAGYVFKGWYDNAACTGTNYAGQTHTMMDNLNLYAKWEKNDYNYTVKFYKDAVSEANYISDADQTKEAAFGTALSALNVDTTIANGKCPAGYNPQGTIDTDSSLTTVAIENNVVNVLLSKRTDLSYTVNYLEKGSNTVRHPAKIVSDKTFGDTVTAVSEKVDIDGYTYDSADKETLTIGTDNNVINLYYTKNPETKTYNIVIHYVDDTSAQNKLQDDVTISQVERSTYNVADKIPNRIGEYVKETVNGNVTDTLTDDVEITVVYTKDVLVDPTVPKTNDPGDNIPDKYQVIVKYVPDTTGRGTVGQLTEEVLTIYRDSEKKGYASEGQVTATGSIATVTGNRCYFSKWTTNATVDTSKEPATLGKKTFNAKGGETYTFTANFGYSSGGGSGGSSRPSTPPTVDIPDNDVPTGLNGKDHYAYIIGYGNNDVRPQNNITRAEVATIFFRLLTDETRTANMTKSNGYNDVKDGDWFCCAVSTLSKMGIIKGYEDGSFKPNDPISRAEFAAIAARFDPDGDKTPATFADVTSHWAKDEISIAANHGWIKGYEDGSFKPDQKITRAETMTLVNRVLNRLPETKDDLHKDMKTWVDNMDETAWYYLDVQEATNSHYFKNKTGTKFEQWTDLRDTRDWSELEK